MVCFCDHSWIVSSECRSLWPDRDDFPLPYACPHDFIFDPDRMLTVGCAIHRPEAGSATICVAIGLDRPLRKLGLHILTRFLHLAASSRQ